MCNIISICNNKGGVGKTTATLNIGAGLAREGYQVLLVDCDAQANLSMCFHQDEDTEYNIGRLLLGDLGFDEVLVQTKLLDMLPSSRELRKIEKRLSGETGAEQRLKRVFKKAKVRENYDYVILDCPPALGNFTTNALVVSDYYLIPVTPEFFGYKGIQGVLDYIGDIMEFGLNDELKLMGILINQFNEKQRNAIRQGIAEKIRKSALDVFETSIRQNSDLIKSTKNGCSIFTQNSQSSGAKDYSSLVKEIVTLTNK